MEIACSVYNLHLLVIDMELGRPISSNILDNLKERSIKELLFMQLWMNKRFHLWN